MIPNALPDGLVQNPDLDRWLAFEEGGRVRLSSGKIELGQGILTALAQIAAEELDVSIERVRIVSGDTGVSPSEGFTTGSNSVANSGTAVRLVCAEARALFLHHLAMQLGCPLEELAIEDGHFFRNRTSVGSYWSLSEFVDLSQAVSGSAPTRRPSDYKYVGKSVPRVDLAAKITGPAFIHDMLPDGVLHARVLHVPWPQACLDELDEGAVQRAGSTQVRVVREGSFLAVVSEDETVACRAIEAARRSAIWSGGRRLPPDAARPEWLMAQPARTRTVEWRPSFGTVAGNTVEAQFSRGYIAHASIAPSCALAIFRQGELSVWSHSQGVFALRDWLAISLNLDPGRVRVFHAHGAGSYGHNSADDAAFDAAVLAIRIPDRFIRVQWTREDGFRAAPVGAAMVVKLRATLDEEGLPSSWTTEIWSPVHGRRPGMHKGANFLALEALPGASIAPILQDTPDAIGGGATRNAEPLYDIPRQNLVHHLLPDVPVRTSSLRSLGAYGNVFAIESFIDELAEIATEDPVQYRLLLISDERARRVIERAAEMAAWGSASVDGRARGFGFARYKNRAAYMAAVAEVEVDAEVRVTQVWAAVDAGLVINPDGARNQVEGGIVQSVSWALKEEVLFEDGQVLADSWTAYPILRFSDVPSIAIELVGAREEPALGIGEVAQGPTAAAIGNAVSRALGVRLRDLPLTRDRILAAVMA